MSFQFLFDAVENILFLFGGNEHGMGFATFKESLFACLRSLLIVSFSRDIFSAW